MSSNIKIVRQPRPIIFLDTQENRDFGLAGGIFFNYAIRKLYADYDDLYVYAFEIIVISNGNPTLIKTMDFSYVQFLEDEMIKDVI